LLQEPDSALLERAKEYDLEALRQLYDLYSMHIYRYLYHRLGDKYLAEELTAQVFLRMLEAIKGDKAWRVSFSAWLYRIAHNVAVDHFRQRARERTCSLDERITVEKEDPFKALEKKWYREQLRMAINRLTQEQGQVIVLRFLEGFSVAEVARIMGKTEGAVKALQHRALVNLRRILQEWA